ncbi:nuclear pore complex protein nup155-like protein [Dinothrombium tinctorium]|uniref:Nuclear pore complex protein nup155-like protein n=1 Tax=Dinothrombium tinctorium TaxID=1965070 RepID=A0A3S3PD15_9ACAR|nr:nuclear pore complex protein nup155-like protein [Dinothrombium tinctorium]RWS09981.1 nuclear pore complex protein nup155-like protein [Dinothrombium tinctorium]
MAIGVDGHTASMFSPSNRTMATNATAAMVPTTAALENSSLLVDRFLQSDSNFHHLHDLLKATAGYPTISGLQEIDYPNLSDYQSTFRSLSQLNIVSTIPLPPAVTEQLSYMQQNCEMGLLPEIGRAWLTVDSNIYLWAYDNATDIAYYDGLTETIFAVGLIKPKPGVFKDHIKYILCLTTTVEILLLGVTFTDSSEDINDLVILPEPISSLASDNIILNVIASTEKGRIFLGGKDGCLYEITYQTADGWFSRKCKKINHSSSALSFLIPSFFTFGEEDPIVQIEIDNSRHILYTRSEKGTIEVFDLGEDGNSIYKVAAKSLNSIVQQASYVARTIDANNFKPIVHLSAIEESESLYINLIAVTENGIRLYFSTTNMTRPDARPTFLNLVHIRLPPGYSASSSVQRINRVHKAHCKRGYSIMVANQTDVKDVLWSLSNDPFAYESQLMELYTVVPLTGKVWKLAEEVKPQLVKQLTAVALGYNNKPIALEPPVIVTEEVEEPRKFIFLSSQGIHIGTKPRPVDHLKQLLIDNQGFDNEAVKGFFKLYKEPQACTIALTLACKTLSPQEKQIGEWATLAFFRYGSEPQLTYQLQPPYSSPSGGAQMSTPVTGAFQPSFTGVASPIEHPKSGSAFTLQTPPNPMEQQQPQEQAIQFSNKHTGLYLYFSRIVRPIWSYHVVKSEIANTVDGPRECLLSSIPAPEVNIYIEKLSNLKEFLERNVQFSPNVDNSYNFSFSQINATPSLNAQAYERNSLNNLLQLISRCLEVLGLWRLLFDHQFHTIAALLATEFQLQLKSLTFRDLIIGGQDICARLASALVQKYIEDFTTTDAISRRLNEACPSIFKQENAIHAKAHEMIVKAKELTSDEDRQIIISEALSLFKRIGARINLKQACDLLESVFAYKEIVELCLHTAAACDEKSLGIYFYKNNEPVDDYPGRVAFQSRMECYKIVLDIYEKLIQISKGLVHQRVITGLSQNQSGREIILSQENAREIAEKILQKAVESNDELMHVAFYDWLCEHQMKEKLLNIKAPFLETYLKRKMTVSPDSTQLMDLLWMYYEKIGHFRAAAHILDKLAEKHGSDIDLFQRLEYLSRAIICMKSCQTHLSKISVETSDLKTSGEFLHELEEKMEVGRIQLQILQSLRSLPDSPLIQFAITTLNSDLLDISQLYENFADRFDLPECQLAIVYSAGHFDPALIETLWEKIIEKEVVNNFGKPLAVQKMMFTNKLKSLAKLYMASERYFPTDFIIRTFECKTQSLGLEADWLIQCLIACGLNISRLLDIYHKLYKSKDYTSSWPRKNVQILKVLVCLISMFCENPSLLHPMERRHFATKCLDVVAGYLLDLQSMSVSDLSVRNIVVDFRNLQSKLDRLSS